MVMQNTVRRAEPAAGFFEEAPPAAPNSLIRLKVLGEIGGDEAVVYIDKAASDHYDSKIDAVKMLATRQGMPNLYTRASDDNLSINAISELTADKEIPLDIVITHSGSHTLEVAELVNFDPTVQVYLEDREKGVFHNLRVVNTLPLDLKIGTCKNRFFLHLGQPVAVNSKAESCKQNDGQISVENPSNHSWDVELMNGQGHVIARAEDLKAATHNFGNLTDGIYQVRLNAAGGFTAVKETAVTAGPDMAAGFEVTQSTLIAGNETTFRALTTGNGITYNWDFGDGTLLNGSATVSHSYRAPGIYKVSLTMGNGLCRDVTEQIITVRTDETASSIDERPANRYFSLYPNPANESIAISLNATSRGELPEIVELHDATGRLILRLDAASVNEGGRIIMPVKELANGSYQVSLITGKARYTRPFVVAH
jgi:PKD repeat protein